MYFVDRELLENRLQYMEKQLSIFSQQQEWKSDIEKVALERFVHMTIEVIIDVGNQMIDGFIMRDPGSYEDVINILVDEKVISNEDGIVLKDFILMRKIVLQEYTEINSAELHSNMNKSMPALLTFPGKVRLYLENELGPVSAFLPSKD
ncbi:DUF86 domain-containing protein [Evansella sp. AB-rgal1]|uniref:DUF86 domain-containing protein n=1 Tax=Evansella sp. AB-rgal1 TaxID=3242696 RepID=UPI00359E3D22